MDDVKDKLKGFMKKVSLSSSSGKFKGPGRVLGSSSSSSSAPPPVNPIHNRFNSSQAPPTNPTPRPKPNPTPTQLPDKPISSDQKIISGSTRNPDPDPVRAPPQDGFDPYGAFITSSNRSQNGYSLNMFECPICKNAFTSEEEVSVHVESCLGNGNTNGEESSLEKDDNNDNDISEIEKLVVVYLSGKPSESSVDVLLRLFKNIVKEPENAKFRKIRMSNAKIKEAIGDVAGGVELLELVGFELKEENNEIWAVMDVPGEEQSKLISKVVGFLDNRKIEVPRKDDEKSVSSPQVVEPVAPKKIDREIRVFFSVSENVASRIAVPDSFYSLSADEIKREADLRRKKIAESQLLIPRSYKEKQAKAARRRYKRSMIRVQFPDGVVLQGVFAPWEPTIALYEFVSSALKEPSLQFELLDPVLVKRRVIPHTPPPGQKPITLEDEELVPSALIKFRPIETDSLVYTGLCNELLEISEPLS
ncbi:PREDICTED: plant UBX domain-containing protein 2-like [Camelina sativa]|uniref:Plant UBX domain-containing protein 2-like n=1 Tax=Camelina sativa TaxID=90675 RepID=A0ABM0YJX4_CAMSA|nr:PREDICTED: plant UBX domain-containing protein 2-like [Camelina sativa]